MKLLKSKKALILSILALSLPAIIEMALNTMLGVADTIMLGHLIDSSAIVSVGFSNQIVFMLIFTFSSFNTGAVALISRAYGEKNYVKLKHIAEQNMLLNLIVGAIMLGISWMIKDSIFKIYDIEPSVLNDAVAYFTIILIGMVPMFLSFSFAAILRGSGNTKTPMYVTGVVNVFNIIGNYVLITGFGPFPEMGIAGAALSTSISRIIAMCIYINKLYIQDSDLKLKLKLFFDKKVIEPLFRISWPGAIEQFLMQLSFVVIGVIVAKLSTDSESLFRILIQIESLSFMPAVGISIAAATLVGKSLGEKDIDKATETGFASAFMGVIWGVIMAVIFILTPDLSIKAFTTEQSIVLLGMPVIPILAVNQPFLNFMIVMGGALRGAGDTRRLMLYTIARLWILFIPLSYLCIIVFDLGVTGVWYAEITSIVVFSTVIFKRFNSKKWASISVE
jgi:putative MATE family efflux protein